LELEGELFKRRMGVLSHPLADQGHSGRITARPTTAGMRPWGNLSSRPPPLQQLLHKRGADAEEHRQGQLGAKALVIGLEDFLSKVNRIRLHACQPMTCSPSKQLQIALGILSQISTAVYTCHAQHIIAVCSRVWRTLQTAV
jgi:hypothetical protein